jgi:hypothetical protein
VAAGPEYGRLGGGGIAVDNPQASGVVVRNDIVSGIASFQILVASGVPASNVSVDHNLIDGFRGTEKGETRGTAFVERGTWNRSVVLNDGGAPGKRSGDGDYVPAP